MGGQVDPWPILVISLEVATQRRQEISDKLHKAGLQFTFVDAVDGRTKLPPEWEPHIDRQGAFDRYGYGVSEGEFACALSHQLAYARILDQGLPGAVILEDDAILTPDFAEFYRNRQYTKADHIQLFCFEARIWRGPGLRLSDHVRLHRLAENPFMNVGYTVSAKGAAFLQAAGRPLRSRADWPGDITQIGAMLTVPSIIHHVPPEHATSFIEATRREMIPAGFDFSARYVKGWRRLVTPSAWVRFVKRRLSREISPGFPSLATIGFNR